MNEPRKEHYVPRTYLQHFSMSGYVWVLRKKNNNKIFRTNITNILCERDYYALNTISNDKFKFEKFYSENVEPLFSRTLKYINSYISSYLVLNASKYFTHTFKNDLCKCIQYQLFRVPNSREYQRKFADAIYPSVISKAKRIFPEKYVDDFESKMHEEENYDSLINDIIIEVSSKLNYNVNKHLSKMVFVFKKFENSSLITSDNPVIIYNRKNYNATPFKNGLKDADSILCMPLSPNLILECYNPLYAMLLGIKHDFEVVTIPKNDHILIQRYNKMQYNNCNEAVIALDNKVLNDLI